MHILFDSASQCDLPAGDCDLIEGTIATSGDTVVGGDYEYCNAASTTLNRWTYPAGGTPTSYTILSNKYAVPNGVALSTAK